MDIQKAYNIWSEQYDTNENKTRDLEAGAIRKTLAEIQFSSCLEIGCGTGKNTAWLVTKAKQVTSVDFSEEMLAKAKEKIISDKVNFIQADITEKWKFTNQKFDIITFSLVLEHIENLDHIFSETAKVISAGGYIYIGELHPFKQYSGSKARFESEQGTQVLTCFNHHVSDFVQSAKKYGFDIADINEHFDDDDRNNIPRVLTIFLKKIK